MHGFVSQFSCTGLAAQAAGPQPKKQMQVWAKHIGSSHSGAMRSIESGVTKHRTRNLEIPRCAIARLRFALARPRNDELPQAARILERNASISERSTSASRRSAP